MPQQPPVDKTKRQPGPPADPRTCRQCRSAQLMLLGRMEKSKESVYRCVACGFVFTIATT
jgi:DNA-directed RNA polymerase subunit M/transcription elongation factor TFIIS